MNQWEDLDKPPRLSPAGWFALMNPFQAAP